MGLNCEGLEDGARNANDAGWLVKRESGAPPRTRRISPASGYVIRSKVSAAAGHLRREFASSFDASR